MSVVTENFEAIQSKIDRAARLAGRDPASVQLVAVSKTQTIACIRSALDYGHRVFGENRVQEAQQHWADLRGHYADLCLHLIGPLQTNKVRDAVALFDVIETLDREKLATSLAAEMRKQDRALPCLIQVNTGAEAQKAGIGMEELDAFYDFCVQDCGLSVEGLMCIPPVDEPPGLHFGLLAKRARALGLSKLSMGMSADFENAIAFGATHIRIGSALFGLRDELNQS